MKRRKVVFGLFWNFWVPHTRAVYQGSFHYKQSYLPFPSRTTHLKMSNDDLYVGVPATSQEVTNEHHDHPIESSETHTHAGLEASAAPNLSAPTLVGPFLLSIAQYLTSWS